ncbi:hypothetical protein [Acidiferrobacter sp.]|jgi:hypothetical protein|uniref:hypothetical protein n=1 Tax=Acidiferrobacter sp. TaxID=1872107 RepID=UPI002632A7F7|nr:hypothetical protein [Acidiferrobacter sp.]
MTEPRLGLGPVARALVAGAVVVVTPPRRRGRCVGVTLATPDGELPILVPAVHKIYTRIAERARRGDFWVVEADLVAVRGGFEIRVRHLISSRDTGLPAAGEADPASASQPAADGLPLAL